MEATAQPEVESDRRRRRRRSPRHDRRQSSGSRREKLRLLFFSLASVWGFVTGAVATLASVSAEPRPTVGPSLALVLVGAIVVAVLGGVVAARAYRNALN